MIDWLLRHPVVIIVIVMIVSAIFRQKKAADAKASTSERSRGQSDGQPKPVPGFDDNDDDFGVGSSTEAERAQRLREEIRRKIAERSGQSMPTPATARAGDPFEVRPAPVLSAQAMTAQAKRDEMASPFQRRETPAFTAANARPPAPAVVAAQVAQVDAVLEQQRLLAEKLDALNAVRRAASSIGNLQASEASTLASAADVGGAGWLRELRGARSLRKAIVLREVVGPPVALR